MSSRPTADPVQVTPDSVYAADWAARLSSTPAARPRCALALSAGDVVVVVGAHPDDETFGFGASIAALVSDGIQVHGVSASFGEAALDHVGHYVDGLGERRAREYAAACRALGMASSTLLHLPDSRLQHCQDEVRAGVAASIRKLRPAHLLTVWWNDPHPDHRAVGDASVAAAVDAGCPASGFPIWAPHWSDPADEQSQARAVQPMLSDASAEQTRRDAVACYRSQTEPLSPDLTAVLPASMLQWTVEGLVRR